MSDTIDHTTVEGIYARNEAPWETGRPHPQLVAVADGVTSPVLDAGCGTGEVGLFLAAQGHEVTGINFVEEAIRRARSKAAARGLKVEFLLKLPASSDRAQPDLAQASRKSPNFSKNSKN